MDSYALIPEPVRIERRADGFELTREVTVSVHPLAEIAGNAWSRAIGWEPRMVDQCDAQVRIVVDRRGLREHGYRVLVGPNGIDIVGADPTGAFYAVQTLRQLLPVGHPGAHAGIPVRVPGVYVEDHPWLQWRGLMLDVARHFMPKEFVLRLIDILALYKINTLHLHLTDDQGWRIEVPGYPRLTEVGAWRAETVIGHDFALEEWDLRYDGRPHGGYYSTTDLMEIVDHARARSITVVPEVDMPGHMQAAIAAYPELGNGLATPEVRRRWGVSTQILNLEETAMEFCFDVLDEVCRVFPSEFIHCGGDEVPQDEWRTAPRAQDRIKALGLRDEAGLQSWFTRQIAEFLRGHRRRLVGWDDILDAGAAPARMVVMPWRGDTATNAALASGAEVVMTQAEYLYFNYNQAIDVHAEPLAIGGYVPLPEVQAYAPPASERVVGMQAQLWTEYIDTPELAEYMLFPRVCALAEAAWNPPDRRRGYDAFEADLRRHLGRLDKLGVRYRSLDR